jgi:hypothetical protein
MLSHSIAALLLVTPAAFGGEPAGSDAASTVAGFPAEQALLLGERMYREGIGTDGEPLRAIVAGDVPVDGRMFSCVNCHRRSGIGSKEGAVITWPVNGKELFVPRRRTGAWRQSAEKKGPGSPERWSLPPQYQVPDARPAYTEETLAAVIRGGVDPTGRQLNTVMPRFELGDRDMVVLTHYLKSLSGDIDPGADERTIRFATVVTEGVSEGDRESMLSVLRAHIDAHNTQTRPHLRRASEGPFYMTEKYGAYRTLELDLWELRGPPETWRDQLEAYYSAKPVFALLGGIAAGPWAPVHAFSEEHGIPAILPITDQPVVSDSDWYTLYFSKGLYQEGEAAARFLHAPGKLGQAARVVQVFRPGTRGEAAARGFRETWEKDGQDGLESRPLEPGEDLTAAPRLVPGEDQKPTVVLLWLDGTEVVSALNGGLAQAAGIEAVFASWSLAQADLAGIPEAARGRVYLTYPRSPPEDNKRRWLAVNGWLKAQKIPPGNPDIQAKMYFLGWMLPGAIGSMRSEFYRDYFLEGFDMMPDQDYAVALYPRLSFGPDQRYASKGCYIAQLAPGEDPQLRTVSNWVIH